MDLLSKIADYIIEPVGRLLGRQVGYVIRCKSNLKKLEDGVEKLKATKDSVAHEVDDAERRGEKIQSHVQLWLNNVDKIIKKTDELLKDENQAKLTCLRGFCPNLTTRHQLSRDSTKLVPDVVALEEEGRGFTTVSCGIIRQDVSAISPGEYQDFQSRTSTVEKIMAELQNPNTNRIGVYGIGGVGKTTLVEQVYRQALVLKDQKKLFDDVIIILDVKKSPDPEEIQKKIVEKLGMKINESESETTGGRASRLCGRIQGKKVVVILDDVWKIIDLKVVGIPDVATCKVLLTSRSRTVLSAMGTQPDSDFMLDILSEKETWVLFEKKAGDVVQKDPAIRRVATQVAKYCRGLPVLIVTVASALKKRTSLPPWNDALTCLMKGSNTEELTEAAYLGLEWSYKQLNEQLKPLFLLCGFTIRGNNISLPYLFNYSMGLGILGKTSTLEEARNSLYSRVEKLKDFCLLMDNNDNRSVRMHDLVRDVANQIAFRDGHIISSVVDGAEGELKEWPDKDFLEKCTAISFPRGNNIPTLPEVMQCPGLKLFLVQGNGKLKIPPRFFEEMKQLSVLCLEDMTIIPSRLSSFQSLKHVQTLCLEKCWLGEITLVGKLSNLEILSFADSQLNQLPTEIAQLTRLRLLDLTNCHDLQFISPGVISSLTRLEDLRMNSFFKWKAEGEEGNASLLELRQLSHLAALEIHIPHAEILPANLFSCWKLERYRIVIDGDCFFQHMEYNVDVDTTLNTLHIAGTIQLDKGIKMLLKKSGNLYLADTFGVKNTPDHQLDTGDFQQVKHLFLRYHRDFTYMVNIKVVLPNLTTLVMYECNDLKFLFPSSMARSLVELKHLEIYSCRIMEEIVLSTREDGEENMDNIFPKLQCLILSDLPKLVRFSTSSYIEFSSLEELTLKNCYELGSFICDPKSEERESADVENENALPCSLFDEKVGFRRLERLQIERLKTLKTIWHSQVAPQDSFCRLRAVHVSDCKSLINIFPPSIMGRLNALQIIKIQECKSVQVVFEPIRGSIDDVKAETAHVDTSSSKPFYCRNLDSVEIWKCKSLQNIFPVAVARGLEQLQYLLVSMCEQLEGIIVEEAEGVTETPELVFPKVTSFQFVDLPRLESFYTAGMRTSKWPSLKKLRVHKLLCKVFASQVSFFREKQHHQMDPEINHRPLFLVHKDSFPELEELKWEHEIKGMWYGDDPSPAADFFPKLKSVWFEGGALFSKQPAVLFLEKLQNLQNIELTDDDSSGLFVGDGSSGFPRVRYLRLYRMQNLLLHLGNQLMDKSQSAATSPVFPNLQVLELYYCLRLTSLDHSSAISFQNLTTLKVYGCDGVKYLLSYSVAKSLVQLTILQVEWCNSIEVIIATDGDDAAAGNQEIDNFNLTLQHLSLVILPCLQGFCSRNYIVKFPSLQTSEVEQCNRLKISPDADGVLQITEQGRRCMVMKQ